MAAARIRFVVLMDHVDEDLKNLIAFVHANSEFVVYGVEIEFYDLEGDATLAIPRLYGGETPGKDGGKSIEPVRDAGFFDEASSTVTPEVLAAMRALYEFSASEADTVTWGRGATGSFNPKFHAVSPKSLYGVYSDGRLYMNFRWLGSREAGRAAVEAIGKGLKTMGFALPADFQERFVTRCPVVGAAP